MAQAEANRGLSRRALLQTWFRRGRDVAAAVAVSRVAPVLAAADLLLAACTREANPTEAPIDPSKVETFVQDSGTKIIDKVNKLSAKDPHRSHKVNTDGSETFGLSASLGAEAVNINLVRDKDKKIQTITFEYARPDQAGVYEQTHSFKHDQDGVNWVVTETDSQHDNATHAVTYAQNPDLNDPQKHTTILTEVTFNGLKTSFDQYIDVDITLN